MAIQFEDMADHVRATLKRLGRLKFSQIAQQLQRYPVMREWLTKDRVNFDGGLETQRTLLYKTDNVAAHVGEFEVDQVNITDYTETFSVPWRRVTWKWGYGYREALINRGRHLIFNVILPRRIAAFIDGAGELEKKAWTCPAPTSTVDPYGVFYWICYNASDGFTGSYPTYPGGSTYDATNYCVNLGTITNFKNYYATYTNPTADDLVYKARDGHLQTGWVSPVDVNDYRKGDARMLRWYTDRTTWLKLTDVGTKQNENLGRDLASMDGETVMFGHPIRWVPKLDSLSGNPLIGLDHSCWEIGVLSGDYLRETIRPAPLQHNWTWVHIDLSYKYICNDRRRQMLFATENPIS